MQNRTFLLQAHCFKTLSDQRSSPGGFSVKKFLRMVLQNWQRLLSCLRCCWSCPLERGALWRGAMYPNTKASRLVGLQGEDWTTTYYNTSEEEVLLKYKLKGRSSAMSIISACSMLTVIIFQYLLMSETYYCQNNFCIIIFLYYTFVLDKNVTKLGKCNTWYYNTDLRASKEILWGTQSMWQ